MRIIYKSIRTTFFYSMMFLQVDITSLRQRKEDMDQSSINDLFIDEIDEVLEERKEDENQNTDSKMEEENETVQVCLCSKLCD